MSELRVRASPALERACPRVACTGARLPVLGLLGSSARAGGRAWLGFARPRRSARHLGLNCPFALWLLVAVAGPPVLSRLARSRDCGDLPTRARG